MNYKLNMLPLDEGGTAVLDYEPSFHSLMEETLMLCGREDIVLCSRSYINEDMFSMHLISDKYDLTDWWKAVKIVSDKYAE
jgi:hypothetical protein